MNIKTAGIVYFAWSWLWSIIRKIGYVIQTGLAGKDDKISSRNKTKYFNRDDRIIIDPPGKRRRQ